MKADADLQFGGSGIKAVPSPGGRPGNGRIEGGCAEQERPARAHAATATGGRRAPTSPAEPAESSTRASQNRAHARDHLGSSIEMHVPGPRPLARSHRCEAGPRLRYFSKTSQVILTQALHGNPQRILGSMELPGLSELRDSGRSARELGQGSALPVSQRQRTSHRHPGARGEELAARDAAEDVCLHLPPGAGAAPTWPPSRRDRLRGGVPQPVLTGAEAMGGAGGSWLLPVWGIGGREGAR